MIKVVAHIQSNPIHSFNTHQQAQSPSSTHPTFSIFFLPIKYNTNI